MDRGSKDQGAVSNEDGIAAATISFFISGTSTDSRPRRCLRHYRLPQHLRNPIFRTPATALIPSFVLLESGIGRHGSAGSQAVCRFLVWAVCGFVWIPYWYFWTATPSGSLREKWDSLGRGRKIGYAVLTGLVCLVGVRIFVHPLHSLAVRSVAISPNVQDSSPDAASPQNGTEATYKVARLDTPCAEFKASLEFSDFHLSSDGRFLSTWGELWHIPSRSVVHLDIPGNRWTEGTFSPDGQLFACLRQQAYGQQPDTL